MFVQTSSLCLMRATLFRVLYSRNISIQTHLPSVPCRSIFNRRDPIPTRLVKAVLSAVVNYSGNREMPKKNKTNKGSQKPSETSPSLPSGPVARDKNGVVTISVHAKPGSKQNAITDISEDAIGVAIAAPPSDGEANAELVRYLSKVLELKKSEVVLDKGSRSREKLIKVSASLTPEEALERLKQESTK